MDQKDFETELAMSLIENQLYDEALSYLNRLIDKYPENKLLLFLKGKILYITGLFQESIEVLTTIIANQTDYWQAYELLGEVYRTLNQSGLAETFYSKATEINPQAMSSWLGRGKMAYQQCEFQIATLCFETYLRSDMKNIEIRLLLARSYREMDNYLSAIDAFNETIDIDPTNQEIYEELGDLYVKLDHPEIAREKYSQALQVEEKTRPVNKEIYYKLIELVFKEENYQKAFNLCNELLTIVKSDPKALFLSGKALIKLNDIKEGRKRISEAYDLEKNDEYWKYLEKFDDNRLREKIKSRNYE